MQALPIDTTKFIAGLSDDEARRMLLAIRAKQNIGRYTEFVSTFPKQAGWPPDYAAIIAWREMASARLASSPPLIAGAKGYYRANLSDFIDHWCVTYDPRNAGTGKPARMPFIQFGKQRELAAFFLACIKAEESGLVEKCRDMGATWEAVSFSIGLWLFWPGASIGWGSRKEQLVDKIGDPDSIFEKMRMSVRALPAALLPRGFNDSDHMTYMKFINPENDATITGEAGSNIGRGGRKLIYFKDEAQPLGSKILTPDGWQTMADMRVGSTVVGVDGRPATITQVKDCGEHEIYRFLFSDGTAAECSPNHLWTVEKVWGKRERTTLSAKKIADRFCHISPGGQTQYLYRVPTCAPVEFSQQAPLPLHPYLVGALLGDGSVGQVPLHCACLTTVDQEIVEQFDALLPEGCVTRFDGGMGYRIVDERGRQGNKPDKRSRARRAVVDAGIAGMRSGDKRIPHQYLFATPADRLALLQGLMDTDGSASNAGAASFHTSSEGLAEDVRFLVQSLGGTATFNVKPDARHYKDQFVLHLALTAPLSRLSRKLAAAKPRRHPPGRTIIAVERKQAEPVRCISIDRNDGLYVTDHCIVTHNSAHYERPEMIEAALADNTRVQIDISSVNGIGNVFYRRREAGKDWIPGQPLEKGRTAVFVMDWRDHPAKTQEWYDTRRQKAKDDGLLHVFAQEVERNYAASVEGTIIPAEWVRAAIGAREKLGLLDRGLYRAALDVADGGGDTNALAVARGIELQKADAWGARDTGETTRRAVDACEGLGFVDLQYDSVGVGAGVKAEANRLEDEGLLPHGLRFVPWNAGAKVIEPDEPIIRDDMDSPLNGDFYYNFKAQAWWRTRQRFEATYRAVMALSGGPAFSYDPDEIISLHPDLPMLRQIEKELSQPTATKDTRTLKLIVNKTPEGSRSPNLADAIVMAFNPLPGLRPVYPIAPVEIEQTPFKVPPHWPRGFGMKVEADRVTALWGAWDKDADVLYFISEHSRSFAEPGANAQAISARGTWMPGFMETDTSTGETNQAVAMYQGLGLLVGPSEWAKEAGISNMLQRVSTGRLKVFSSCTDFFREYRSYRRDEEGRVLGSGLIDCGRILCQPSFLQRMIVKPSDLMVSMRRTPNIYR